MNLTEDILLQRFEPLDDEMFQTLRQSLLAYIQTEYLYGSAESTASCEYFSLPLV